MRRIQITDKIKGVAWTYSQKLEKEDNFKKGESPKARLLVLSEKLKKSSTKIHVLVCKAKKGKTAKYNKYSGNLYMALAEYVKVIYDNYDGLNALLPSEYDSHIGQKINNVLPIHKISDISEIKVKLRGKKLRPFYELVVEAMRYDRVQQEFMPDCIRDLSIKTCVYCNSQFATTASVQKIVKLKKGYDVKNIDASCYDLDHNKAKSKYPYLCTNFYNLQPCCSSCNRRKNDRELDFSLYYEDGDTNTTPVHFAMAESDIVHFRISNNGKGIKPYLCNEGVDTPPSVADKSSMAGKMNDMLNVQGIYDEHEDIVEEILWKHKIYSSGFMTATINQIKSLGLVGFDMKRFILGGYYDREGDFLRRPLSIMKNDLWEQLERTRGRKHITL